MQLSSGHCNEVRNDAIKNAMTPQGTASFPITMMIKAGLCACAPVHYAEASAQSAKKLHHKQTVYGGK